MFGYSPFHGGWRGLWGIRGDFDLLGIETPSIPLDWFATKQSLIGIFSASREIKCYSHLVISAPLSILPFVHGPIYLIYLDSSIHTPSICPLIGPTPYSIFCVSHAMWSATRESMPWRAGCCALTEICMATWGWFLKADSFSFILIIIWWRLGK